jgi:outer membrane phospholipase A
MDKLDKIFSEYIRLRDADDNGYIRCYCCGYQVHWEYAHNMHFMNRRHLGTRFSEENCHGGCEPCNSYNGGNLEAFEAHLKRDYGESIIDKLTMLKTTVTKFVPYEIEEMKVKYKQKVKELRKEKGL